VQPSRGFSGLPGLLRDFADWRPRIVPVPRALCHFLALDIRNLPQRYLASSIRLQLAQLTGMARLGFAYHAQGNAARLWYWDEAELQENSLCPAGEACPNGVKPWPEPLLRGPLEDGLHLVACGQGYEAVAIEKGGVWRTRWFRERPEAQAWVAFVRDAGRDPASHPLPASVVRVPASSHPPKGWRLSTHLLQPITAAAWAAAGVAALVGAVLIVGLLYEFKLNGIISAEQAELKRLLHDNATTIALQRKIGEQTSYLGAMNKARPLVLQLELMKRLAESGLVGEASKISLAEWEYRNDRLRLLFSVPDDGFSVGEFLASLESLDMFTDIRLMPDTPPRSVGIQASLAPVIARPAAANAVPRAGRSLNAN